MYDAINRAFEKSSGDVLAWINSDDMYHPYAFETVSQIFTFFNDVNWITGIPNSYNSFGSSTGYDKFPDAYSQKFIKEGYYDAKFLEYGFNWIQQESTFWRRKLWESIGSKLNTNTRYASDFYLWQTFSEYTDLVKVESFLGGYRSHDDQITSNPELYRNELPHRTFPPENLKFLFNKLKEQPCCKSNYFKKESLLLDQLNLNRNDLIGRVIYWSFQKKSWQLCHKAIF